MERGATPVGFPEQAGTSLHHHSTAKLTDNPTTGAQKSFLIVPNIQPPIPKGVSPTANLIRKSNRKYELRPFGDSGFAFPLESRDANECQLFIRREYVWRPKVQPGDTAVQTEEQRKVVYQQVDMKKSNLQILQPSKFLDFRYRGRLERDDVVSIFESVALGKKPEIDLNTINFRQELHPKVFARDYVHASIPIE